MAFRQACALLGVITLISATVALIGRSAIGAEENVGVTEITPGLLVFTTTAGNVVASVGPDGALLVGTPATASTTYISNLLASRAKSALRYVVIAPQDLAHSEGDAGWGQRGAFVAMHENALQRIGGNVMGARHRCRDGSRSSESTVRVLHSPKSWPSILTGSRSTLFIRL